MGITFLMGLVAVCVVAVAVGGLVFAFFKRNNISRANGQHSWTKESVIRYAVESKVSSRCGLYCSCTGLCGGVTSPCIVSKKSSNSLVMYRQLMLKSLCVGCSIA